MKAIIVGGGVGGLSAAIALRRAGHEPIVLEQVAQSAPVGAGLFVTANGMKALSHLGADAHVRAHSVNTAGLAICDLETDHTLGRIEFGPAGEERYGDGCYLTYRPDLFDALAGAMEPGDLRLGSKVIDISVSKDSVSVGLASGERVTGDGLIASDGLNSRIRTGRLDETEAQYTGYTGWRAILSRDTAPGLFPLSLNAQLWIGPRRQIVIYPVHNGELLNVLCYVPVEVAGPESWTAGGDPDLLRQAFKSACRPVQEVLAAVDSAFLTPVYYRRPLPSWGTGPMTLLGDAAHAALPFAAQGASMALEDAVILGGMAERFGPEGFERVFREYEARRIPRTSKTIAWAVNNLVHFTESDPEVIRARHQALRVTQQGDPLNERTWGWLYSYDARTAINKRASHEHDLLYPSLEETDRLTDSWLSL